MRPSRPSTQDSAASASETPARAVRPRILLADEDAAAHHALTQVLGADYEVVAVRDGAAALTRARQEPWDLVLADLSLPTLNGLGLLGELRADDATRTLPVMLFSSRAGDDGSDVAMAAGAVDYVTKPFAANALRARIAARLESARVMRDAVAAARDSEWRMRLAMDAAQMFSWEVDLANGRTFVSGNVERVVGFHRDSTPYGLRETVDELIHPEDRARVLSAIDEARHTGTYYGEIRLIDPATGQVVWVESHGTVVRDAAGQPAKLIGVTQNIAARKEFETALERGREQLQLVTDSIPSLISYVDSERRYRWCNRAYTEWFGLPVSAVVGRTMREVVGDEAWRTIGPHIDTAFGGERVEYEAEAKYQTGARWIHAVYTPHCDHTGAVIGVVVMVHDISEARRAADALRESASRFDLVRDGAEVGFWFCDLPFDKLIWDNRVKEHFWLPPGAEVTIDVFYERLHPADRERVREAIDASIRNRTQYDIEYRTVSPAGGNEKWIRAIGRTFYDAQENPRRFDGVTLEITDRKQIEHAMKENDRRKDEFLAMLAHELRNPLAPIRHAAEVLKITGAGHEGQQWARDVIERQTQHITRLVDDLLDVSRITRGKITLRPERITVASFVERAVEAIRPVAEARGQTLSVALPAAPLEVHGDQARLVQVLSNLLSNASKFNQDGGQIALTAAQEGSHAVIRVTDNGIGIPRELVPHVFELFTQADRSLDRSQGGLGIGLTLVRLLVDLHGGAVEAHSEGPGRGSEFVMRLPLLAAAADAQGGGGHDAGAAKRTSRSKRILIVEDNVDAADMLRFVLALEGHEVEVANDGARAIEVARRFRPRVIVCDIGLPHMNGYEVAHQLRALPDATPPIMIALSGYGQDEDRRRASEAGFAHHLVKPVEPQTLFALLDSLPD